MAEICNKPVVLNKIEFNIWGVGNPLSGDPREICTRQFSKHIVWLCRKKSMSASEIAAKLGVPTIYVEEELEILTKGINGEYGLLRRQDNGKYAINFILFDKEVMEQAVEIYAKHLPEIGEHLIAYIEKHKAEYLAFPYLNKKPDLNLILWQQISVLARRFEAVVQKILEKEYFPGYPGSNRPFTVFGFEDYGKDFGCGWDCVGADNICGYRKILLNNIYITRIQPHFHCDLNIALDPCVQLTIRSIHGLRVDSLTETEKEHAAKGIACGYLYREDNMLYTKILVNQLKDDERIFDISKKFGIGDLEQEAQSAAAQIADLIRKNVPSHLFPDWRFANELAALPILNDLVEVLIEKGVLTPLKEELGAEGCWMSVEK